MASGVKKDHDLATELWGTEGFSARLLAVLIMDKTLLDQAAIEALAADLEGMTAEQRNRISEWLMANQLMKSAKTKQLLEGWVGHPSPVLRRLYWYHQARLRWTGKVPVSNAEDLLGMLQANMADEHPDVQWAMNFCAGWIGVFQPEYRKECIDLGERLGLYKGMTFAKGCTPDFLPEFIRIEAAKREG